MSVSTSFQKSALAFQSVSDSHMESDFTKLYNALQNITEYFFLSHYECNANSLSIFFQSGETKAAGSLFFSCLWYLFEGL
jgi:hypothetical protein